MRVDVAEPYREQSMPFDQLAYLLIFRQASAWEMAEVSQDDRTVLQTPHGDFADNERVTQNTAGHECGP